MVKTGLVKRGGQSIVVYFKVAPIDEADGFNAVDELRVESRRSHFIASIDGETEPLKSPLTYRIRPGALRAMAPVEVTAKA